MLTSCKDIFHLTMHCLLIFMVFMGKQHVSFSFGVRKGSWWKEKWCQTLIETAPSENGYKLHFKYLFPPVFTAAEGGPGKAACLKVSDSKWKCLLGECGGKGWSVWKPFVHCRSTRKLGCHARNGVEVIWCFGHTHMNNLVNWLTPIVHKKV